MPNVPLRCLIILHIAYRKLEAPGYVCQHARDGSVGLVHFLLPSLTLLSLKVKFKLFYFLSKNNTILAGLQDKVMLFSFIMI